MEEYKLTREQKALIKNDTANKKVWDEAMQSLSLGPVRMATCLHIRVTFRNVSTRFAFVSPEILEQSWRSFPLHLLSRSGRSAHHHRVPTQRLQGEKPPAACWTGCLRRINWVRCYMLMTLFHFLNSRNAFRGPSKQRYTPVLRAGMT